MELSRQALEAAPEVLLKREWLETNGRAGFSSASVAGPPTRRQHAILLVARQPPHGQVTLLNYLEQWVDVRGETWLLGLPFGPLPRPTERSAVLVRFSTWPWSAWTFQIGAARIEREIFCPWGHDAVVVRWRLVEGPGPVRLHVRPYLTGRCHSDVTRAGTVTWREVAGGAGRLSWQASSDLPGLHARHPGTFAPSPGWVEGIEYPIDHERGEPHREDWWCPGEIELALQPGTWTAITFSTCADPLDVEALVRAEADHRRALDAHRIGDPLHDELVRASSSCITAAPGDTWALLAGYPWFGPWARDTFTAFCGLCLVPGHHRAARGILEAYAPLVSEGMVPHQLPPVGGLPEYKDLDTSLWFVRAVERYLAYTRDDDLTRRLLWPAVREILDGYRRGTRWGIRVDADGLVTGGAPGQKLTWMDAKFDSWVVTPRRGKPVEVQALWASALVTGAHLARRYGDAAFAERCVRDRQKLIASFRARYWNARDGYLYDVVDGPDGNDATLRPNQLFAIALDPDLVPADQARRVVDVVEDQLLTPVGLRTLPRSARDYHPRYVGPRADRDAAYHQGTVWPYLLAPFIRAWLRVHGATPRHRARARGFLEGMEGSLRSGCIGHLSEIFDAEPPHSPRGCFAQAWSTGELLLCLAEDLCGTGVPPLLPR